MKFSKFHFWLAMTVLIMLWAGCARNDAPSPGEMRKFHSGSLEIPLNMDVPTVIYVDMRNEAGPIENLPESIRSAILQDNFKLTDSPSKAGYILHLNILREGEVDPEILRDIVNGGYGSPVDFSGDGSLGMVADAILVQRTVPTHKRPSRERLKNISRRNALDSGQLRVGLALLKASPSDANHKLFYSSLAQELEEALKPHSEGQPQ